ncbi:MAG TPA: flagellar hook-length control protein FliK [Sideroxyarcus sp.]|nr:flagellar hook-length control protein FliK [Sideroxyarcus sp.]
MLPPSLLSTLKTLALTDRPLISATPDKGSPGTAKTPNLEIGQKVQANVEAQVAPSLFRVRVADQMMQMHLPPSIKPGDTIQLQVVSLLPRLTFTLAASANPVSTPDSLSAASRMLSSLSQQPLERSYVRPIQSAPLWTGEQTAPDITQLANKLNQALSHSGLFYESHQAQWIAGMRPTSQLLLEPQNQLPHTAHNGSGGQLPAMQNNPDAGGKAALLQNIAETGGRTAAAQTAVANVSAQTLSQLPDDLRTLVQQQLNALETRQVLWQGPVWQGQEMTWEVREDSSHRNARGEQESQWNTQVHLDLPNLGGVTARLSFTHGALNLALDVADPQSRERLGKASSQLVAALTERGIPVIQTKIGANEHAG